MSLMPGPVPGAPNLTAQPLPQAPNPGLGSATIALDLLPAGIVAGIPVPANFLGISIELSVASDIFGEQLSNLYAPFLNYVSTISTRLPLSMGPSIRVGGNTQDTATYNTSATAPIVKVSDHGFDPETGAPITPFIQMSPKLFDIMQAVGEDLRAQWVFGVNFVNLSNTFTQPMVRDLSSKLSTKLQMLLVGNEPDRYSQIGRRGPNYTIPQYLDEWDTITSSIIGDTPKQKFFVAPSVCCAWTTDQVIVENGMANRFQDRLAAISAIKYPQSLCATGPVIGHAFYLNHTNTIEFGLYDQDAVATAIQLGLPYTLIETNTASCIGIDYVSNAFSSTLWGIDAALQLAYRNHSGMYLHTAGQSVVYNLFTPPSYRQSIYTAWRTGPIMYALPFVAEALNSTDGVSARVRDLGLQTPAGPSYGAAYGIYEDDAAQVPSKVVLLNLVSDQSGANTMRVQLPPADQQQRAVVKFLAAATAAEQQNITWAGQTFGYYSDGVLNGQESVQTIRCNDRGANNTGPFCTVTVPAPGAAIVYLTPEAQATAAVASRTNAAFEPQGTADPAVVIDSNGSRGRKGGATSKDSASGAAGGWRSDKQASRSAVITCVSMALLSALAPLAFQIM
ncbi:hypothetical protein OC846_005846 [Tilletia horrida]|uniref:Beta-glucuronidase C-terminal domain-containing protein n=1 Tax=Tilletia horrida TaxID=155126 RepID=A0AAN6JP52_9BASI|nr:hypothetical protein OC846_005846 [Tilletia horrida]KAK0562955.1 hypothetical protein OC861_005045 [Tilletia horrida]